MKNNKHFASFWNTFQPILKGNFRVQDSKADEQEEQKAENFAE